MYENRTEPLLPWPVFRRRLLGHAGAALAIVLGSLAIGIAGYHFLEGQSWIDSFLNTAMLLGGMGPVNELRTTPGKVFAGVFALYAGLVFLVVAGLVLAPILHRFLHRFHLEAETSQSEGES